MSRHHEYRIVVANGEVSPFSGALGAAKDLGEAVKLAHDLIGDFRVEYRTVTITDWVPLPESQTTALNPVSGGGEADE